MVLGIRSREQQAVILQRCNPKVRSWHGHVNPSFTIDEDEDEDGEGAQGRARCLAQGQRPTDGLKVRPPAIGGKWTVF